MKPFGALLQFEEALKTVIENVTPVTDTETISINEALGRVLAQDLVATHNTPPFNRAAMDGYAVKAEETFGASRRNPRLLKIVGAVFAGSVSTIELAEGQAIQIATGAMLPAGADAVVMVEDTEKDDQTVKIFRSVSPQTHVARLGEDIRKGETVLKKETVLDPGKIGVLASQGLNGISVFRQPEVAVMPTGEEVAEAGQPLKPGQVYDINSYTISAVATANGSWPQSMGITGDTQSQLKAALNKALDSDVVVISGGSSVGERDLLAGILEKEGQVLFHGIQVKPGKPTLFAIVKGKPVFGMPGYPTSCLINAYLLLLPALRKMAHLLPRAHMEVKAELDANVPGSVGRRQFLPVRLEDGKAKPIFKESGAITGTAMADGYIEIGQNVDMVAKGETVTVTLF